MSPEARERSFDELARGLASGSISRGRALRWMGAALVGGTLGSLGGVAAADAPGCKRNGKVCTKDKVCCSRICESGTCAACRSNGGSCSDNDQCCSGTCSSGTCVAACVSNGGTCSSNEQCCSGFCSGDSICAQPKGIATCHCVDGATLPGICTDDCSVTQEEVCVPFCANHGGAEPAGCDGPVAC